MHVEKNFAYKYKWLVNRSIREILLQGIGVHTTFKYLMQAILVANAWNVSNSNTSTHVFEIPFEGVMPTRNL